MRPIRCGALVYLPYLTLQQDGRIAVGNYVPLDELPEPVRRIWQSRLGFQRPSEGNAPVHTAGDLHATLPELQD